MEDDMPEVKTGNGVDRDLAATTNDRLKKTVLELRGLGDEIKTLNANVIQLNKSSDRYSHKLIVLTWVLIIFTVFLVVMTGVLIEDGRKAVSNQNNITLTQQFFNTANTNIINALENGKPILQENKGQFTDAQLDNYLGDFDTIQGSYDNGLLSEDDLCDSFSYYIQLTDQNAEVQSYINEQNKLYPSAFTSLAYLTDIVNKSNDSNCK